MDQSPRKRGRFATAGALSMMMMMIALLLLAEECSGNSIEMIYSPPPPARGHIVEIAGMMAYYEEGQGYRDLGIVLNEYEYDDSSAILDSMRLGSAQPDASDRRRIVRQSVCYDVMMETEDPEDVEIVSKKVCEERAKDRIIQAEQFTITMIQQVVRELRISDRPAYIYRIDDGQELLDFDLQFTHYHLKEQQNWSQSIMPRTPEWRCVEQTPRMFECLWTMEDAAKRIVRGLL